MATWKQTRERSRDRDSQEYCVFTFSLKSLDVSPWRGNSVLELNKRVEM